MLDQALIFDNISHELSLYKKLLSKTSLTHHCSLSIRSKDFRDSDCRNLTLNALEKFNDAALYLIKCSNTRQREKLIQQYLDFQQSNRRREHSKDRVHISRYNAVDSNVLYVGVSQRDFTSRIGQHLGAAHRRVYAMHLPVWDNGFDYKLEIEVFRIAGANGNPLPKPFVELIEQAVWTLHLPVFGKKGGH